MSEFLKVALHAAQNADAVTMKYFREGAKVMIKADQTPVTIADQEAERVIIATVKASYAEHGFLGEESGASKNSSEYLWIIDPIDGTKNFVRNIPLFGTQIALMQNGKLVTGVSSMPAMSELLYADEDAAYLNGKRVLVSDEGDLSKAAISFAGLNRMPENIKPASMFQLFRTIDRIRAFGDCYPFHLVATGRLEAVVQSFIHIWDIAALVRIIESAGGRCTDFSGGAITVDSRDLLATNGKIHDELLDFLKA